MRGQWHMWCYPLQASAIHHQWIKFWEVLLRNPCTLGVLRTMSAMLEEFNQYLSNEWMDGWTDAIHSVQGCELKKMYVYSWSRKTVLSPKSIFESLCYAKSLQSCSTLQPYGLPGSSVQVFLQARIVKWVAVRSSSESSRPKHQTLISYVSSIGRWVLYH